MHLTYLQNNRPYIFKGHGLSNQLIVTLTSYPQRYDLLVYSLQSILNQTVRPDKIILYLYKEDVPRLNRDVCFLMRDGLEIRSVESDIRSYKKIIPALIDFPDSFIVTADDDIIYKPTWLEELVQSYKNLGGIIAHRAHILQFDISGSIQPYNCWIKATPVTNYYQFSSPFVFPTGGAGVLYPPKAFDPRVTDISLALKLCPTSDDIWLYFMALLNNNSFSLIGQREFFDINKNPEDSLWNSNKRGLNDEYLNTLIANFGLPTLLQKSINTAVKTLQKYPGTVKLLCGKIMIVKDDHIGKIISNSKQYYESDLINYVKRFFFPCRLVDVGSNIGNHAVGFSGHKDYKVVCFEPDPHLACIATQNLMNNKISHVMNNFVLGAKNQRLYFTPGTSINSGLGYFTNSQSNNNKLLQIHTLDKSLPFNFKPDCIKIDVEGMELQVLEGSRKILSRYHPLLLIKHQNKDSYDACFSLLKQFGYIPIGVKCKTPTFIYLHANSYDLISSTRDISWPQACFS